jgi:hypothetical protein
MQSHGPAIYYIVSVACLAVPYFFTLIYKRAIFFKVTEHKMKVWFSLHILCKTFLIEQNSARHNHKRTCKEAVILVECNETWIFWTEFREILKYQISWKSVEWEASCSIRTDGVTFELANSTFRNFANASKTGAQTCFQTRIQEYYTSFYVNYYVNWAKVSRWLHISWHFEILHSISDNAY